ncbi:PAS domain-containing sensor histidine kinase [Ferruginibacter paludis]|uniref:PAS domain-containing sensor histidine kinase n=1 Tax=Ferruginibacter paludis TaxID=1310417 RepID=UPI0025B59D15|nr:PAS domain-containing sensor histidine kinase [Ferruginibacter paludis]MDN3655279.1 PAS domain-containing sensor histidine kinase [Ferruginibacter paludis]
MKAARKNVGSLTELRKKAEKKLMYGVTGAGTESIRPLEIEHELNVHKVELEMQNEELRLTQLQLEKSLDNYAELFQYAPVGYFILDINGIVLNLNDTASKLLGEHKNWAAGRPFSVFLHSEICQDDFYRHRNLVIDSGMPQEIEVKFIKKDSVAFPALITSTIVKDEEDHFKYFLSTVNDISERKEQEQKMKMALSKEVELNELKSRFISTASHEFRTPLATILLSTELLEKYNEPDDEKNRKKHFQKIKSAVLGLTEILMDFLSLDKFENGVITNNPEYIDLVSLTTRVIEDMNIRRQPVLYKHADKKQVVYLDPKLLRVCVTNIIGNAFKYSHADSPVEVTTALVDNDQVLISVKDHGIGIPEHDKPFIFDRFFRSKTAEAYQGTGLGLNIVQKFTSVMNGHISFTSVENEGSTFVLQFPNM